MSIVSHSLPFCSAPLLGSARFGRAVFASLFCACLLAGCGRVPSAGPPTSFVRPAAGRSLPPSEQWTGFRGGPFQGVAPPQGFPDDWETRGGIVWQTQLEGSGSSSPVIWGERILLTEVLPEQQLQLNCLRRSDGAVLWQRVLGTLRGTWHSKNDGASATVTTDGGRVFVTCQPLGVFCFDLDGHPIWNTSLGNPEHPWGFASSPLLFKDLVIQLGDSRGDSKLVALDRASGELVWETSRASQGCWATPVLIESGGRWELIVNGSSPPEGSAGRVTAYDPQTGRELWSWEGTTDIPCPSAIVGGGLIISSSGSNGPIAALRPGVRSDRVAWETTRGGPYVPTGVIVEQRLFLLSDSGLLRCLNVEDGSEIWKRRLGGSFSSSLIACEDKLIAVSEQGVVHILGAEDRFARLGTVRLEQRCLATPAIAGGQMFVRAEGHLYCLGEDPEASYLVGTEVDESADDPIKSSPSDRTGEPETVPADENDAG